MPPVRRIRKFIPDRLLSLFQLYPAVLILITVIIGAAGGKESTGAFAPPLLVCLAFYHTFMEGGYTAGARLLSSRLLNDHRKEARRMMYLLERILFFFALLLGILCFFFRRILSLSIYRSPDYSLLFLILFAAAVSFGILGVFHAYFSAVRITAPLEWCAILLNILNCVILPLFCGRLTKTGRYSADLLKKPECVGLYGAAGLTAGILTVNIVGILFLFIIYLMMRRNIQNQLFQYDPILHNERGNLRDRFAHVSASGLSAVFSGFLKGIVPFVFLLFFTRAINESRVTAAWLHGLFVSSFAPAAAFSSLVLIPFTGLVRRILDSPSKSRTPSYTRSLTGLLRLLRYVLIALTFYLFGSASAFSVEDAAFVSLLRTACFILLCAGPLYIYERVLFNEGKQGRHIRNGIIAAALSFALHLFLTREVSAPLTVLGASVLVFYLLWTFLSILSVRTLRQSVMGDLYRTAMMVLSAVIAAFPVTLLAPVLRSAAGGLLSAVLSAVIFFTAYAVLTLMLGCADTAGLSRLYGGELVTLLHRLMISQYERYDDY